MDYSRLLNEIEPLINEKVMEQNELNLKLNKLQNEIDQLIKIADSLHELADDREIQFAKSESFESILETKEKEEKKNIWDSKDFDDVIVSILRTEGRPMTSPELNRKYNSMVSESKHKTRSSFSGMLSQRILKTDKYERIETNRLVGRIKQLYGLPDMFDNRDIKQEYLDKLELETELF